MFTISFTLLIFLRWIENRKVAQQEKHYILIDFLKEEIIKNDGEKIKIRSITKIWLEEHPGFRSIPPSYTFRISTDKEIYIITFFSKRNKDKFIEIIVIYNNNMKFTEVNNHEEWYKLYKENEYYRKGDRVNEAIKEQKIDNINTDKYR